MDARQAKLAYDWQTDFGSNKYPTKPVGDPVKVCGDDRQVRELVCQLPMSGGCRPSMPWANLHADVKRTPTTKFAS